MPKRTPTVWKKTYGAVAVLVVLLTGAYLALEGRW